MAQRKTALGDGIIRSAHGNGSGAILRAEATTLKDLPPLNEGDTAAGLAAAARRGKPFTEGNRAAENRKPALALLGVSLDAADPRVRSALRKANSLRQRRVRELAVAHGGYLGSGPCAMLGSAYRALAASTVLFELATEALAAGRVKEAADLFTTSAGLAEKARTQELTAVGLAARETKARTTAQRGTGGMAAAQARILGGGQ